MRNTPVVVCPRRSLPTCFAIDGPGRDDDVVGVQVVSRPKDKAK